MAEEVTQTPAAPTPPTPPAPQAQQGRPSSEARKSFDKMTVESMGAMIPIKASAVGGETKLDDPLPPPGVETVVEEEAPPPPPPEAPGKLLDTKAHKTIRAIIEGADPLEVRADARFEYKVNGQTVVRPLQEILERQSGIDNTDRYWAEYQKAQENWQGYLGKIIENTKAGKGLEAIVQAVADQGHDPVEFTRLLRQQLAEGVARWSELPDTERKALELQEENEYYRKRLEQQQERAKVDQQQALAISAVRDVESRYGMPEGAWQEYYGVLATEQQAGRFPNREITVEEVGQFYKGTQDYKAVEAALKATAPSVLQDKEAVELLLDAVTRGRISREELPDIIQASYGEEVSVASNGSNAGKAERNVSEKILSSQNGQSLASKSDKGTVKSTPRRPRDAW